MSNWDIRVLRQATQANRLEPSRMMVRVENSKVTFWLVIATYPSEKYEFVNWDDDK